MRFDLRYASLTLLIFVAEVLIATVFAANPLIRGSLGDILVVPLIYFGALTVARLPELPLAAAVFALACAVEASQYFQLARRLGLEDGSVLSMLLGTTFSWHDLAMYLIGALVALALSRSLARDSR